MIVGNAMKHTPAFLTLIVAASALAQTAPTPAPTPAPAKSEWTQTHNLALATDYIFRGVSQIDSSNALALSGGTDFSHTSGLSFGLWAANQNFNSVDGNDTLEIDTYAAYAFKVGGLDAKVGAIAYNYPGAYTYNTVEVNASVSIAGATLAYSHSLTDYFGLENSDGTGYLDLSYSQELGFIVKDLTLALHAGWTAGEGDQTYADDYRVALSYPVAGYTATLAYSDADYEGVTGATGKVLDKSALVLSFARTF